MTLDGANVVLVANVDASLASANVQANDDAARTKAIDDVRRLFGEAHRDDRTQTRPAKWGLVEITDPCGRPLVNATATPPA